MAGTSSSLTSLTGWGGPTVPLAVGSPGQVFVQVAQFSVMPKLQGRSKRGKMT